MELTFESRASLGSPGRAPGRQQSDREAATGARRCDVALFALRRRDGDTVFNQLQLPILLQELETRLRAAASQNLKSHGTPCSI